MSDQSPTPESQPPHWDLLAHNLSNLVSDQSPTPEGRIKILLLCLSFFLPLLGFIIGAMYYQKQGEANRQFGKEVLLVSIMPVALGCSTTVCMIMFGVNSTVLSCIW